jgi:hypothetical protein
LENKDATGNRGFGTTTPSFSSLRVTGSFGARGAKTRIAKESGGRDAQFKSSDPCDSGSGQRLAGLRFSI